ncbi:cyclic nucleotide-binding domain-containing protein [Azospirillum argentinense]|uniref:cyclic nucleotide-binding domain-containing protein n=1 Tax=Azospirillum argentinense TaxID=2970906 RepID=UPI001FFE8F05|nr:cyclic nucleotide-binding domain-containing protein [Azospirillum argentinense]
MSDAFDFSVPPFDRLTPEQRQRLAAALDLGVYARDGVILSRDEPADCLFVVRQGLVHERRGGEVVAVYGAHDSFDLQALFSDGQARSFVAAEDTLCDLVPRPILLELAHENAPSAR